jgi:hypothetical protein
MPPLTDATFKKASWDWVQNTAIATSSWGNINDWDVSSVKDFARAFSRYRNETGDHLGAVGLTNIVSNPLASLFAAGEISSHVVVCGVVCELVCT